MRRGSACLGCIFQRANRYRLLFSSSKLFIHTDKQGEKGDVRSRGRRRRRVSDMRVFFFFQFLSFSLLRLSLLSSLDSLLGLRVKLGREGVRKGEKRQKEGDEQKRSKREGERQEETHGREEKEKDRWSKICKKQQKMESTQTMKCHKDLTNQQHHQQEPQTKYLHN